MRVIMIAALLALTPAHAEARLMVEPAGNPRPVYLEVAGAKKCPFLTRWSEQWRKCVWRWGMVA